jgi:hypothetical protein
MSYNLAVWEGARPKTDADALGVFNELMDKQQSRAPAPPTTAIRQYVEALLARWPDLGDDDENETPWSDGPLINNATGPIFYFGVVFSAAEEAVTFAASLARKHGLVCFDPQSGTLL